MSEIQHSSPSIVYSLKEGYSAPFIPPSTSYVKYSKQYSSMSGGTKMSTKADTLSSHQKSVVSASPIVATYDYSPFGQLIATSGTPELSPIQFSSENHRRHVGDLDKRATRSLPLQEVSHRSKAGEAMTNQIFDPEIALTYYNHRYYNPTVGRWLSRDPTEEDASLNLYTFVNNAPNYRTDYLGLNASEWVGGYMIAKDPIEDLPTYSGTNLSFEDFVLYFGSLPAAIGGILGNNAANLGSNDKDNNFVNYIYHYFTGTGGVEVLNVKKLIRDTQKTQILIKENLLLAYSVNKETGKNPLVLNKWKPTSVKESGYIFILDNYQFTMNAIICGPLIRYNFYVSDVFDFHYISDNSNALYSYAIENANMFLSPLIEGGKQTKGGMKPFNVRGHHNGTAIITQEGSRMVVKLTDIE